MTDVRARPRAVAAAFDDSALTEWPFDPDEVEEGTLAARGTVVWRSTDETRAVGFWECSAGRFSVAYRWTETALILSGLAVVTTAEAEHRLEPGRMIVLPVGIRATWVIPDAVQTAFHLAADIPLPV